MSKDSRANYYKKKTKKRIKKRVMKGIKILLEKKEKAIIWSQTV